VVEGQAIARLEPDLSSLRRAGVAGWWHPAI
jgi:hypothetical protein